MILIVEDDEGIAAFVAKGLKAEGYATTVARDGDEALALAATAGADLDLVLLDLALPGTDGLSVLRRWRSERRGVPVIVLTARDGTADKVRGLDAGADDYVTKPFAFEELLARVRAALRSVEQRSSTELVVDDLRLDLLTKLAWRAGRRIDLAPREWALLELFMRHPDHLLSRSQILARVWDYDFDPGTNVVEVYVSYLRRKLNQPGLSPLIRTVRGAGYRLRDPAD
ncbi:response regulator [Acidimicrobiaceae bacterium USS-CC1]|uniref:Response regulator n=1 Tax=Acidiferrimicrobium australe TaxID=2664430 RepID=A0ABW9QQL2_9ACTN|nr:response regulator [Acidiferrimicrobium australe]